MLVPRDSEVQLNCSVTEGNSAEWSVELPETTPARTDIRGAVNTLQSRGFTLQGLGTTRLTLTVTINEEPTNNATFVTCLAVDTNNPLQPVEEGNRVQILFYGNVHNACPSTSSLVKFHIDIYRFASTSL